MVVDDELALRALVARGFRERGYEVLEVSDAVMALDVARVASPPIDLVVTNSLTGHPTGVELITRLRENNPTLPVIHLLGSHHPEERWYDDTPPEGIPTLFKPFNLWDLIDEAEKTLATKESHV
jgi:DNA-binding response OmpR family regulator